jgi:hypothetical protein
MVVTRVSLGDVLELLSGRSLVPSQTGNQCDQLRDGMTISGGDRQRALERSERNMLRSAAAIRCLDGLLMYRSIRFVPCDDIRRFAQRVGMGEGEAAIGVMRAFQPWASQHAQRGLVEVYEWLRARDPRLKAIDARGEATAEQAFRVGKARGARAHAATLVGDAEVVVSAYVERWNRQAERRVLAAA